MKRYLAMNAFHQNDREVVLPLLNKCLRMRQQSGNKAHEPGELLSIGRVLYHQGQFNQAKTYFQKSLALWWEMGNTANAAEVTHNLGKTLFRLGHLSEAKARFIESLVLLKGIERREYKVAWCLLGLAQITDAKEQPMRIATLIGATEVLRSKTTTYMPNIHIEIEEIETTTRTYLDEESFNAAYARGLAMNKEQAIAFALSEQVKE